eukprot:m.156034 g.156034  ORF g.156034 m.156034 type:complete len:69 (-) comp52927_c3_seq4:427-633(-)
MHQLVFDSLLFAVYDAAIEQYTLALSECPLKYEQRSVFFGNRAACYAKLVAHLSFFYCSSWPSLLSLV